MSLLIDEARLKLIKYTLKSDAFENFRYRTAMRIKDDSKKLEALALFEEEGIKEEVAETIKDDDKK